MESGNFHLLGRRWTPELAPHAHVFLFTQASLRLLLEMSGFETIVTGTFHLPGVKQSDFCRRLVGGELKWALWRAMQEAGAWYSRLIGSGPMLYAVARRALTNEPTCPVRACGQNV
jgi:hypothetical protein